MRTTNNAELCAELNRITERLMMPDETWKFSEKQLQAYLYLRTGRDEIRKLIVEFLNENDKNKSIKIHSIQPTDAAPRPLIRLIQYNINDIKQLKQIDPSIVPFQLLIKEYLARNLFLNDEESKKLLIELINSENIQGYDLNIKSTISKIIESRFDSFPLLEPHIAVCYQKIKQTVKQLFAGVLQEFAARGDITKTTCLLNHLANLEKSAYIKEETFKDIRDIFECVIYDQLKDSINAKRDTELLKSLYNALKSICIDVKKSIDALEYGLLEGTLDNHLFFNFIITHDERIDKNIIFMLFKKFTEDLKKSANDTPKNLTYLKFTYLMSYLLKDNHFNQYGFIKETLIQIAKKNKLNISFDEADTKPIDITPPSIIEEKTNSEPSTDKQMQSQTNLGLFHDSKYHQNKALNDFLSKIDSSQLNHYLSKISKSDLDDGLKQNESHYYESIVKSLIQHAEDPSMTDNEAKIAILLEAQLIANYHGNEKMFREVAVKLFLLYQHYIETLIKPVDHDLLNQINAQIWKQLKPGLSKSSDHEPNPWLDRIKSEYNSSISEIYIRLAWEAKSLNERIAILSIALRMFVNSSEDPNRVSQIKMLLGESLCRSAENTRPNTLNNKKSFENCLVLMKWLFKDAANFFINNHSATTNADFYYPATDSVFYNGTNNLSDFFLQMGSRIENLEVILRDSLIKDKRRQKNSSF